MRSCSRAHLGKLLGDFLSAFFIDWSVVSMGHGRLPVWQRGSSPLSSGSSIQAKLTLPKAQDPFCPGAGACSWAQDLGICDTAAMTQQGLRVASDVGMGCSQACSEFPPCHMLIIKQ